MLVGHSRRDPLGDWKIKESREVLTLSPWPRHLPLVSVVIPVTTTAVRGRGCGFSLGQTFQDLEVIVVNDGSNDPDTLAVLSNLKKPKTRVVHQENLKLPAARNRGIREARGKYICCLDADDLLKPTYLEKCVVNMELNGVDICYSNLNLLAIFKNISILGMFFP